MAIYRLPFSAHLLTSCDFASAWSDIPSQPFCYFSPYAGATPGGNAIRAVLVQSPSGGRSPLDRLFGIGNVVPGSWHPSVGGMAQNALFVFYYLPITPFNRLGTSTLTQRRRN